MVPSNECYPIWISHLVVNHFCLNFLVKLQKIIKDKWIRHQRLDQHENKCSLYHAQDKKYINKKFIAGEVNMKSFTKPIEIKKNDSETSLNMKRT